MATKKKKPVPQAHAANPIKKRPVANKDQAARALHGTIELLRPLSSEKRSQVLRSVEAFYARSVVGPSTEG